MFTWKVKKFSKISPGLKKEITQLWHDDPYASPFVAPSYLELMVKLVSEKGQKVVFCMMYDQTGYLAALWPMRLNQRNHMSFLQYCYCDYTTALYRHGTGVKELADGFALLLTHVKPDAVILDNIPEWGLTLNALQKGLKQVGFKSHVFSWAKAPVLQGRLGTEGIKDIKRQLGRNRSLKNYTNRLKRENGFFFEADPGAKGIDQWVDEFINAHRDRWKNTPTPSKYEILEVRHTLKEVLKAWAADYVLIRFSVYVTPRRITFAVGLKSGDTLIHFHTARLPVYNKLGTGNITIRLIGFWMIENGYNALDFGLGEESYKYYFANRSNEIWRLYAAKTLFSPWFLRGGIENYIRSKKSRLQLWQRTKMRALTVKRILGKK